MRHHWPLAIVLSLFAAAVAAEIGWGLPGRRRAELLAPGGLSDELIAEVAARSQGRLDAQVDLPVPLVGRADKAAPPPFDRGQALDATRRFLLYTDNPDEMLALMALARIDPARGDFDPGMSQYGGAFLYPLGAWLRAASLAGLVRQGDLAFYLAHPEAMGRLYLFGRILVAICVLGALAAVYRIGLLLGDRRLGTLAAAMVALSPALLSWSVVLKPHAAALLPGMLCLYWSLRYYEHPCWPRLLSAAIALGVAVGMTAVAAPLGLSVLAAVWLDKRRTAGRAILRTLALALVATWTFLIFNPYAILSFDQRLEEARHLRAFYAGPASPLQIVAYLAGPMRHGLGILVLAPSLVAMAAMLIQQTRRALVLCLPLAATFLLLPLSLGDWAGEPQMARFALPALPAALLVLLWWIRTEWLLSRRVAAALVLAMLPLAGSTVIVHAMNAAGGGPREAAAAMLNAERDLPVVVDYPAAPFRAPPLAYLALDVRHAPPADGRYVSVTVPSQPVRGDAHGRIVFRPQPALPAWLRSPVTFADRDVVVTVRKAALPDVPADERGE